MNESVFTTDRARASRHSSELIVYVYNAGTPRTSSNNGPKTLGHNNRAVCVRVYVVRVERERKIRKPYRKKKKNEKTLYMTISFVPPRLTDTVLFYFFPTDNISLLYGRSA